MGWTPGELELAEPIRGDAPGEVWRARLGPERREVDVEFVDGADLASLSRLEREATVLDRLGVARRPALIEVMCFGGRHAVLTEPVEGELLSERLARGPLPAGEAIELVLALSDDLTPAHRHHISHGGITAARVVLTPHAGPVLGGYGIVACAGPGAGRSAGASPEVRAGGLPTPRTDVYALAQLLVEVVGGPPPATVAAVVAAAIEPAPSKRPPDAGVLAARLRASLAADAASVDVEGAGGPTGRPPAGARPGERAPSGGPGGRGVTARPGPRWLRLWLVLAALASGAGGVALALRSGPASPSPSADDRPAAISGAAASRSAGPEP